MQCVTWVDVVQKGTIEVTDSGGAGYLSGSSTKLMWLSVSLISPQNESPNLSCSAGFPMPNSHTLGFFLSLQFSAVHMSTEDKYLCTEWPV